MARERAGIEERQVRHELAKLRGFWGQVLLNAFRDARYPGKASAQLIDRDRAIKYLTNPSKDLEMVCAFADVDMGAVIKKAKEAFLKQEKSA